jgi:putative Mg2+ transporter-C (MgtC) family protein
MNGFWVGQGWLQISELLLAFVLSAIVGAEREIRLKSAGLRTYTLVGTASALIMLVSKYGFDNILSPDRIVLDPSRIAAQIVTGIGFIGGGVIFVRKDIVRGLTTAAIVWLNAAIGMACGAGLPVLAIVVTGMHFVVVFGFPRIAALLPRPSATGFIIHVRYRREENVLRDILIACTTSEFRLSRLNAETTGARVDAADGEIDELTADASEGLNAVALQLQGTKSITKLAGRIAEIPGVVSVKAGDAATSPD